MPKYRKLEYFEDQLNATAFGREILKIVRSHMDEVMYLVNNNRPTMVCWQRHYGPKFIRSVMNSGFEENIEFVKEVDGVTLEEILLNMAEVLQDNGSQELKNTIGKYARLVLRMARETSSLKEVLYKINNTEILQQHE